MASSPSAGGVVGTPSVELRWTGTDALSGIAAVYVVNEVGAGLGEIAGLPAPDLRLAVGQRTGGAATVSGTARVALPHAGESLLRARVVDGAGNWVDSAPVRVTYVEPPKALAAPRVQGAATPGGTLTCDGGAWAAPAPTLAYAWLRDGVAVVGASGASYPVTADDVGHRLECRVRAGNAGTAGGRRSDAGDERGRGGRPPRPGPSCSRPRSCAARRARAWPSPAIRASGATRSRGSRSPGAATGSWSRAGRPTSRRPPTSATTSTAA